MEHSLQVSDSWVLQFVICAKQAFESLERRKPEEHSVQVSDVWVLQLVICAKQLAWLKRIFPCSQAVQTVAEV